MSVLRRLICKLGFHTYRYDDAGPEPWPAECIRCGKQTFIIRNPLCMLPRD